VVAGVALLVTGAATPASATPGHEGAVREALVAAAAWAGVAPELLAGIAWVESGGHPWALGINGHAVFPRSYGEAAALVRAVGARADIGVAQINFPTWGPVFALRPEELLDPWVNLHVAALILRLAMEREPGSWGGVGRYHSATPWRKWRYARRVAAAVRTLRPAIPREGVGVSP
jgi:hypothetical protein